MDIQPIKEFTELEARKNDLETELARIKARITVLDPIIQDELINNEINQIKVNGRTVFLHKQIWAGSPIEGESIDRDKAIAALLMAGLDDFVKKGYNTNSLSGYLRECNANGTPLPESFKGVITANEVVKIKSIKS